MSLLKKTSSQSFVYMFFQAIGIGVSFISFPIMTRIFSLEDYGNLALINTTVALMIATGKCGLTTSFIKHYAEFASDEERKRLYSSSFAGTVFISLALILVCTAFIFSLQKYLGSYLLKVLLIIGLIFLFANIQNLYIGFYRAEEKVLTLNIFNLLFKVGSLASGLFVFLTVINRLYGYLIGMLVFQGLTVFYIGLVFYRKKVLEIKAISTGLFKKLIIYGFPLTFFEISSLINDYSDRFLIKYFVGAAQVGVYSAGYNIAMYVNGFITAPIWMTIFPIYTKLWETEGKEKTENFLSYILKYYICIGVITVFIVSLLSKELIVFLASKKYSVASEVIPIIVTSTVICGTNTVVNAPYFLLKQTKKIALYTIICAVLNIVLNLYVVPRYGIIGAAYTSAFSYLLLTVLASVNAAKLIRIRWPVRDMIFYLSFAVIVTLVLGRLDFGGNLLNLIFKFTLGTLIYGVCVFFYDYDVRNLFFSYLRVAVSRD